MDAAETYQRLEPIRDEFLLRFYDWSKQFSQREFERNFPTIGRLKNAHVRKLVLFARSLNRTDKSLLCSTLLKRYHKRAVEMLDDYPSDQEEFLFQESLKARRAYVAEIDESRRAAVIGRTNKTYLSRMLAGKLALVPALGERAAEDKPSEWTYCSRVESWILKTHIDLGGRRSLGYAHSINVWPGIDLRDNISILSWMGISAQTDWIELSQDEYTEAVGCLVDACKCFLDSVPKLLEGLSHDLTDPEVRYWRTPFIVRAHRKNGFTTLISDEPEIRKVLGARSSWKIPTSIIPDRLRTIGSHLVIVQDPSYTRETAEDSLALSPTYRHLRIEQVE